MCTGSSFLLANARIVDYPIVYCNDAFVRLTGYSRPEVMQRAACCSFMAGELTGTDLLLLVTKAMDKAVSEQVEVVFYKKNSTYIQLT